MDMLGQKLRRGVAAGEFRHLVEIAVVERLQDRLEHRMQAADIDHDAVWSSASAMKAASITKVAVQRLRRPEHGRRGTNGRS